jgi:hypothetical protein
LLKSNVSIYGEAITLKFRSKGGKIVTKEFAAPRLARVIALLRQLHGRRLFQYQADGASKPMEGILATVLGFGGLVFAAVGVVMQLKDDAQYRMGGRAPQASGIWHFVRTYMVSLAAVLSLGFLLLISLLLTTALALGGKFLPLTCRKSRCTLSAASCLSA